MLNFVRAAFVVALMAAPFAARAQTPTTVFAVRGSAAQSEVRFTLATLRQLPVATVNVSYISGSRLQSATFTGALLWDVVQKAGIVIDPNVKNDLIRKLITVTAADGYQVTFSAGEIAPNFGGKQIMVAYEADGAPLGANGFARIVVPGDKAGGRFISNINRIIIFDGGR